MSKVQPTIQGPSAFSGNLSKVHKIIRGHISCNLCWRECRLCMRRLLKQKPPWWLKVRCVFVGALNDLSWYQSVGKVKNIFKERTPMARSNQSWLKPLQDYGGYGPLNALLCFKLIIPSIWCRYLHSHSQAAVAFAGGPVNLPLSLPASLFLNKPLVYFCRSCCIPTSFWGGN